ncbi:hypothetical protein BLNAU_13780 [Blattamonas nauphoetae]|uniref:Transmembrane protein n=1 Tax=Blattamonas nauphoetae TaxID=2049346 RepID=A0ABQ9XFP4_9EUKA|nr:hypothetical protein BLNAU_13780 [Blattamonas nauphoetae]
MYFNEYCHFESSKAGIAGGTLYFDTEDLVKFSTGSYNGKDNTFKLAQSGTAPIGADFFGHNTPFLSIGKNGQPDRKGNDTFTIVSTKFNKTSQDNHILTFPSHVVLSEDVTFPILLQKSLLDEIKISSVEIIETVFRPISPTYTCQQNGPLLDSSITPILFLKDTKFLNIVLTQPDASLLSLVPLSMEQQESPQTILLDNCLFQGIKHTLSVHTSLVTITTIGSVVLTKVIFVQCQLSPTARALSIRTQIEYPLPTVPITHSLSHLTFQSNSIVESRAHQRGAFFEHVAIEGVPQTDQDSSMRPEVVINTFKWEITNNERCTVKSTPTTDCSLISIVGGTLNVKQFKFSGFQDTARTQYTLALTGLYGYLISLENTPADAGRDPSTLIQSSVVFSPEPKATRPIFYMGEACGLVYASGDRTTLSMGLSLFYSDEELQTSSIFCRNSAKIDLADVAVGNYTFQGDNNFFRYENDNTAEKSSTPSISITSSMFEDVDCPNSRGSAVSIRTSAYDTPLDINYDNVLVSMCTASMGAGLFALHSDCSSSTLSKMVLFNSKFFDCVATYGNGGGLLVVRFEVVIERSNIIHCAAEFGRGGGLFILMDRSICASLLPVHLNATIISKNSALMAGGVYLLDTCLKVINPHHIYEDNSVGTRMDNSEELLDDSIFKNTATMEFTSQGVIDIQDRTWKISAEMCTCGLDDSETDESNQTLTPSWILNKPGWVMPYMSINQSSERIVLRRIVIPVSKQETGVIYDFHAEDKVKELHLAKATIIGCDDIAPVEPSSARTRNSGRNGNPIGRFVLFSLKSLNLLSLNEVVVSQISHSARPFSFVDVPVLTEDQPISVLPEFRIRNCHFSNIAFLSDPVASPRVSNKNQSGIPEYLTKRVLVENCTLINLSILGQPVLSTVTVNASEKYSIIMRNSIFSASSFSCADSNPSSNSYNGPYGIFSFYKLQGSEDNSEDRESVIEITNCTTFDLSFNSTHPTATFLFDGLRFAISNSSFNMLSATTTNNSYKSNGISPFFPSVVSLSCPYVLISHTTFSYGVHQAGDSVQLQLSNSNHQNEKDPKDPFSSLTGSDGYSVLTFEGMEGSDQLSQVFIDSIVVNTSEAINNGLGCGTTHVFMRNVKATIDNSSFFGDHPFTPTQDYNSIADEYEDVELYDPKCLCSVELSPLIQTISSSVVFDGVTINGTGSHGAMLISASNITLTQVKFVDTNLTRSNSNMNSAYSEFCVNAYCTDESVIDLKSITTEFTLATPSTSNHDDPHSEQIREEADHRQEHQSEDVHSLDKPHPKDHHPPFPPEIDWDKKILLLSEVDSPLKSENTVPTWIHSSSCKVITSSSSYAQPFLPYLTNVSIAPLKDRPDAFLFFAAGNHIFPCVTTLVFTKQKGKEDPKPNAELDSEATGPKVERINASIDNVFTNSNSSLLACILQNKELAKLRHGKWKVTIQSTSGASSVGSPAAYTVDVPHLTLGVSFGVVGFFCLVIGVVIFFVCYRTNQARKVKKVFRVAQKGYYYDATNPQVPIPRGKVVGQKRKPRKTKLRMIPSDMKTVHHAKGGRAITMPIAGDQSQQFSGIDLFPSFGTVLTRIPTFQHTPQRPQTPVEDVENSRVYDRFRTEEMVTIQQF